MGELMGAQLVPVEYEVAQATLSNGILATVLTLYSPGAVSQTLWVLGSASQLAEDLAQVDACTEAGVVVAAPANGATEAAAGPPTTPAEG